MLANRRGHGRRIRGGRIRFNATCPGAARLDGTAAIIALPLPAPDQDHRLSMSRLHHLRMTLEQTAREACKPAFRNDPIVRRVPRMRHDNRSTG